MLKKNITHTTLSINKDAMFVTICLIYEVSMLTKVMHLFFTFFCSVIFSEEQTQCL